MKRLILLALVLSTVFALDLQCNSEEKRMSIEPLIVMRPPSYDYVCAGDSIDLRPEFGTYYTGKAATYCDGTHYVEDYDDFDPSNPPSCSEGDGSRPVCNLNCYGNGRYGGSYDMSSISGTITMVENWGDVEYYLYLCDSKDLSDIIFERGEIDFMQPGYGGATYPQSLHLLSQQWTGVACEYDLSLRVDGVEVDDPSRVVLESGEHTLDYEVDVGRCIGIVKQHFRSPLSGEWMDECNECAGNYGKTLRRSVTLQAIDPDMATHLTIVEAHPAFQCTVQGGCETDHFNVGTGHQEVDVIITVENDGVVPVHVFGFSPDEISTTAEEPMREPVYLRGSEFDVQPGERKTVHYIMETYLQVDASMIGMHTFNVSASYIGTEEDPCTGYKERKKAYKTMDVEVKGDRGYGMSAEISPDHITNEVETFNITGRIYEVSTNLPCVPENGVDLNELRLGDETCHTYNNKNVDVDQDGSFNFTYLQVPPGCRPTGNEEETLRAILSAVCNGQPVTGTATARITSRAQRLQCRLTYTLVGMENGREIYEVTVETEGGVGNVEYMKYTCDKESGEWKGLNDDEFSCEYERLEEETKTVGAVVKDDEGEVECWADIGVCQFYI